MVTRDFDAMLAAKAGIRPTFRVGGQEFTVKAKLPHKRFAALLKAVNADDADEDEQTENFFRMALIREDRDRFMELLNHDDDDDADESEVISTEQVQQITNWLVEHFTGKRPESSASSSDGANSTAQSPNVVSLSSRAG